jgi:hypothetical protein
VEEDTYSERTHHPGGGYWSLPGASDAFSAGVLADEAHQIMRIRLLANIPLEQGLAWGLKLMGSEFDRPPETLCAVELRSPQVMEFRGFVEFNQGYVAILQKLGVITGGTSPLARTNVVPWRNGPGTPSLSAFSFTIPAGEKPAHTFVISGAAEIGGLAEGKIVREGERTERALVEKVRFVLARIMKRLDLLGAEVEYVTDVNVYTTQEVSQLVRDAIGRTLPHLDSFRWTISTPPIKGLDFEMDVRGVRNEMICAEPCLTD